MAIGFAGIQVEAQTVAGHRQEYFPRAGFVFVDTFVNGESFAQWMLDQDTGGAIRGSGPSRLVSRRGNRATALAGEQAEEGQLYYFFLKDALVDRDQHQGLEKRYRGGIHALRGVDLQVDRGEIFGPSVPTAGKSTLVKVLLTIVR